MNTGETLGQVKVIQFWEIGKDINVYSSKIQVSLASLDHSKERQK
jgi:hypothetical protein